MNNTKTIYSELSIEHLKNLLNNNFVKKHNINIIIIKFSAVWCRPCQQIKELSNELFQKTADNVLCFELDIDNYNNKKLYSAFKSKKMIKGVPTLFGFNCKNDRDSEHWYIPDESVSGSSEKDIRMFFLQCL